MRSNIKYRTKAKNGSSCGGYGKGLTLGARRRSRDRPLPRHHENAVRTIWKTAMHETCSAGQLGVCQLHVRPRRRLDRPNQEQVWPDFNAYRLLLRASHCGSVALQGGRLRGHQDQGRWWQDFNAYRCQEGRLDGAQWLFEVGAAEDIRTKDRGG